MKRYHHIYKYFAGITLLLGTFTACKKDYQDASGPSSDQAFSTPIVLADVAAGLQSWYVRDRTGLLYTTVTAGSLLTGETFVTNPGNADEAQLGTGGAALLNVNVVVTGMWAVSNKIVYESDSILRSTKMIVKDAGFASGLIGYTSIFKALSLGIQANFWEQVPDTIGRPDGITNDVKFIPARQGYLRAVRTIDNALNAISAAPVSDNFLRYIPKGINIENTLYALKARYSLYAGDYAGALAAADKVDLSEKGKGALVFTSLITNPVYTLATATNNIFQVVDSSMGLPKEIQPDLADGRVPFYIKRQAKPRFIINGFFKSLNDTVPLFLPGEITLIKAECYARTGLIPQGLAELNKVVTKTADKDAYKLAANLPAVSASDKDELLTLIYKHRRIELYMGGQELEDSRRFNRPVSERKRTYFPYPFVERNDNPNTPKDPEF
ncbi:RagB/SusD family nutrient uptake outer membrane protein [Chitinophaga sp. Mgbs1]|uniref:RagB/SusD family nutrient uptake outer membrane protein n=1 Tax=Chitinophaga solisilvae TaxID=1233460 RepID=A0A3S1JEE4_9BACT|nr:RagB/SusD family nutrient uptake outer membrane protein [Chitinophaga solisilvae]